MSVSGRIWLDADRRTSRYIDITFGRHHADVTLDRDDYVYSARSEGRLDDVELSVAFAEALRRYHANALDYLYVHGYTGSLGVAVGPTVVTVPAPFELADEAAAALRAAELDGDVRLLDNLTTRLQVPLEAWLAPGERLLLRGTDFTASPSSFLKLLRARARERGLRVNGRAEPGAVWVRPTMPGYSRELVEAYPDRYSNYADPAVYAAYEEPDDAPIRPEVDAWARGSEPTPTPVTLLRTPDLDGADERDCACGLPREPGGRWSTEHVKAHMQWSLGVPVPGSLPSPDGHVVVVTATSPRSRRKFAERCARLPRRENHYDFASFSTGDGKPEAGDPRAYLYISGGVAIGFVSVFDTADARRYVLQSWEAVTPPPVGDGERPTVNVIFTAHLHRRRGIGRALLAAIAEDSDVALTDVAWSAPFSDSGKALALSLNSDGNAWVT